MKTNFLHIIKVMTLFAVIAWVPGKAKAQDSLQTYIVAAIRNNPAVAAQYKAYQAQMAALDGINVLPDPEFSATIFPKPMTQVNGKQVASFSVMQMFPWFGALKVAREEKAWAAEAAYQRFREAGIELANKVQQEWYELLAQQERLKSLETNIALLKDIQTSVRYQYKTQLMGKSSKMSDQLRLDAELVRLQEQRENLLSLIQLQKQQFNILLHRADDRPLSIPANIQLRELPQVSFDEIKKASPRLAAIEAEGKSYEYREENARKQGMPKIGLGVQYALNSKRDATAVGVMPDMNGNDMWGIMAKVTLPIYRRRTRAAVKSAQILQQSAKDQLIREVDLMQSELLSIAQQAEDTKRKIKLFDEQMDILNKTLKLMRSEYVSGSTTVTDILQTSRDWVELALKKQEQLARFGKVVAAYEKLASKYDYSKR